MKAGIKKEIPRTVVIPARKILAESRFLVVRTVLYAMIIEKDPAPRKMNDNSCRAAGDSVICMK